MRDLETVGVVVSARKSADWWFIAVDELVPSERKVGNAWYSDVRLRRTARYRVPVDRITGQMPVLITHLVEALFRKD